MICKKLPLSRALVYFTVGFVLSLIINLALAHTAEAMELVGTNSFPAMI